MFVQIVLKSVASTGQYGTLIFSKFILGMSKWNKNRIVRWPAATELRRGSRMIDEIKKICYPLHMSEKCGTNPTVT
jgi:hypothetical protein